MVSMNRSIDYSTKKPLTTFIWGQEKNLNNREPPLTLNQVLTIKVNDLHYEDLLFVPKREVSPHSVTV